MREGHQADDGEAYMAGRPEGHEVGDERGHQADDGGGTHGRTA